jgi:hypothetical protein
LQPLDVAVFGPLKRQWVKVVRDWEVEHDQAVFGKLDFAELFMPFYMQHATVENIANGFRKCGLHLMNENAPDFSKLCYFD